MDEQNCYYQSNDEIQTLVEGFESCRLPPSDFDHRAHLAVAAWYVARMTEGQAIERMRTGLLRFIAHHGEDLQKYNETITQFWIKRVRKILEKTLTKQPLAERVDRMIAKAGNSQLVFDYYSRERVFSEQARGGWVEPDLKPLDF